MRTPQDGRLDPRLVDEARRSAEEALAEYARLARLWNAPDDFHTKRSVRVLAERVIAEEFGA